MKTVIVFDTDELEGMKNTAEIVDHLSEKYLGRPARHHNRTFGKIEFIKTLRRFAKDAKDAGEVEPGSLRYTKRFADKIWDDGTGRPRN